MTSAKEPALLARIGDFNVNDRVATFRIILNDEVHGGLSYRTLRFGGISVSGGELESVQRVNRGDRDHPEYNKDWLVTVNLQGERTVISFPANDITRRSFYTEDGRILANQITITIPDPDGAGNRRVQKWLR